MAKRDVLAVLGRRIRELRLRKGLSQERLGLLAKIDRTYIGGVERGERNVGVRNVERIADALGVSVAELFRNGGDNA